MAYNAGRGGQGNGYSSSESDGGERKAGQHGGRHPVRTSPMQRYHQPPAGGGYGAQPGQGAGQYAGNNVNVSPVEAGGHGAAGGGGGGGGGYDPNDLVSMFENLGMQQQQQQQQQQQMQQRQRIQAAQEAWQRGGGSGTPLGHSGFPVGSNQYAGGSAFPVGAGGYGAQAGGGYGAPSTRSSERLSFSPLGPEDLKQPEGCDPAYQAQENDWIDKMNRNQNGDPLVHIRTQKEVYAEMLDSRNPNNPNAQDMLVDLYDKIIESIENNPNETMEQIRQEYNENIKLEYREFSAKEYNEGNIMHGDIDNLMFDSLTSLLSDPLANLPPLDEIKKLLSSKPVG